MKKYLIILVFVSLIFACTKSKDNKILVTTSTSTTLAIRETITSNINLYKLIDDLSGDISLEDDPEDITESEGDNPYSNQEIEDMIVDMANKEVKVEKKSIKKGEYKISKDYQKDLLEFKTIGAEKYKNKEIAVVGTTGVKLYKDMEGKTEIFEIPKGTILEIKKQFKNEGEKIEGIEGLFKFSNEYNYWYQVNYNNNNGFVFGSYLVNKESYRNSFFDDTNLGEIEDINEILVKIAYYYTKNQKETSFYDFNGLNNIPNKVKKSLIDNKIAFEKVSKDEYNLSIENPDDMIALYKKLHTDNSATTFITIDFVVHNLHLLFDRMLQETESRILYPILKKLVVNYYKKLIDMEKTLKEDESELKETITLAKNYFLVACDILKIKVLDKDNYPKEVLEELELIEKAKGFSEAPLFKYKEDYSQFKPRGHYTKSELLKKYFKAMMWFGRLHFYCETDTTNPKMLENSIRLTKIALLITKLAKENTSLYAMWKSLFDPITYLIGESDDYNLNQYIAVSNDIDFDNFGNWIKSDENIIKFMKNANTNIKSPKISGNTLLNAQSNFVSPDVNKVPGGFRFFGQRFVFDSYITHRLSTPRVGDRNMVKGLDVMGVMGNSLADELLSEDKKIFGGYEENYNSLKKEINNFSDYDFRVTFYNSYLKIIKEITSFENDKPFYFTQSDLWNKKALLTSHGSWAELRHDTILYVKQSYSEKSGKGFGMTWVIDKISRPIGYVEPNLDALYWVQSILDDSLIYLAQNGFMSQKYQTKFNDYKNIIDKLVTVAELESQDKQIDDELNEFIYQIPYKLAYIVLPNNSNAYIEEKEFQMALVADVHTNSFEGEVLEVATGIPYRIYVALNDGVGGKRIAEGYTYSYYEFTQPMGDRLNDDQWKEKVYGNDKAYLSQRIPKWFKGIVIE
ncbi:MAG: hypothetical protein A2086_16275 [Spirochaetes bacterium GWD1_27_9]|nr:MAG: hypothetical protein A2Z98_10770 [Spirochaetes bacterium GWB1_27_13]OHD24637.1 MAG: hypothetical protein A2Y34_00505 [Spirochaetes bacterium GWC1_27_15]OHD44632.1 MAG: hypothetical protein A2086_16275 [Spirochaetes bacterium GWD1_27_9]